MMEEDGIVIKQSDFRLLEEFTGHIEEVFGVSLVVQEVSHVPGEDVIAGQRPAWTAVRVLPGPQETQPPGHVAKAKAYILSLTCAEAKRTQHQEQYCSQAYQHLLQYQNDIERDSQAVLSFNQDGQTLCIWGQDANVSMAKELVERRLCQLTPQTESLVVSVKPPNGGEEEEERVLHTLHSQSLSPGAESNHDSCYDSDTSPVCSRRNSSCNYLDAGHEDVSRTVSDTLAAEHTDTEEPDASLKSRLQADKDIIEGLTAAGQSESSYGHLSLKTRTKGEVGEDSLLSAEDYASKVEFAVKLGYTEHQLQSALQKLGPEVNQNELLSELINLDKSEEEGYGGDTGECGGMVEGIEGLGLWGCGTDTTGDAMGGSLSTNTGGANDNLRPVVIDGSNVAMSHGNKEVFSCQGIRIAVDWFRQRGHQDITVFVPQWRKETSRPDNPITGQEMLLELEKEKILVFTPARRVGGKRVVCYDDRYIIKLAAETSGIVVSNDNYRDLMNESSEFKRVIEERLLMYSFVSDRFMPPDDPLGRRGPSLDNFLCREPAIPEPLPPVCPYGKKCTYGNKCKYYHPERGLTPQKSVTEKLAEKAEKNRVKLQEVKDRGSRQRDTSPGSLPAIKVSSDSPNYRKTPLSKTKSLVTTSAQKTPLGRTKSLAPGTKLLNSYQVAGGKDSRQEAENASCGKDLKESMSSNVKVTVTSTNMVASDSDKYRSYNDKLTEHRRMIERIESEKCLMQNPRHQQQRTNERKHSLKIPNQWRHLPHEALRPTHSDPYSLFSENSMLTSGHLALAKKLSDEGTTEHDNFGIPFQSMIPTTDAAEKPMPLPIGTPPQQAPAGEKKHRKLARQLSLKGSEDPRWQQQSARTALHQTMSFPNAHSNVVRSSSYQPEWRDAYRPGEQDRVGPHMSAYPADRMPLTQPRPAHQGLGRQASYGDQSLCGSGHPGPMDHSSVSRMASAPMTYTSRQSHQALASQPSSLMSRQNSTSDPQLHKQLDGPTLPLPFSSRAAAFTEGHAGDFFTPWNQQSSPCKPFLEPRGGLPFDSYSQTPPQGYPTPIGHRSSLSGPADSLFGLHRPQDNGGMDSPVRGTDSPRTPSPAPALPLQTAVDTFGQQGIIRRPPSTPENSLAAGFHGSNINAPIQPSDSRYKLYYHLCGLFPEVKVRRVLNERPSETNPTVLCALIIGCPD